MTTEHDPARIARAAQAVYLTAAAAELAPDELTQPIEVYSARSQAQGLKPWTPGEVTAPARLRFYRATVSELFVIDGFDQRIRVG
jgi:hypothetical protein